MLIDDAGFTGPDTFGGAINIPTLTRLAENGLSYNRFHVTAVCSPTPSGTTPPRPSPMLLNMLRALSRRHADSVRRSLDCNELVELVTAYLEGALDPQTGARVDAHLMKCDGCENYLQQFRETVRTVGRIRDDELDPEFRNRLLEAFTDFR